MRYLIGTLHITFVLALIAAATATRAAELSTGTRGQLGEHTVFVLDVSGSTDGHGVVTPTDSAALRQAVLRAGIPIANAVKSGTRGFVSVVGLGGHLPRVLLASTNDPARVQEFLSTPLPTSSGSTDIDPTLVIIAQLGSRPSHIIFVSDGLLTRRREASIRVVESLRERLASELGQPVPISLIAVDTSDRVISKTEGAWQAVTNGRIAKVTKSSDVPIAVRAILGRPDRGNPPSTPEDKATVPTRPILGTVALGLIAGGLVMMIRARHAHAPRAFVTIEQPGQRRRTVATRQFGKAAVTIGPRGDIAVPGWSSPALVVATHAVRDARGRTRRRAIVRQAERVVTIGATPVAFTDGNRTIRVHGGTR